jgi:hypothetical protein
MAQRHHKREREPTGTIDDAWFEHPRQDSDVTAYRRTTDKPFVPTPSVTEPVDEFWLLGRGCTDGEEAATEVDRAVRNVPQTTASNRMLSSPDNTTSCLWTNLLNG